MEKYKKKITFLILFSTDEITRSRGRIRDQLYGSPGPDSNHTVTNSDHWLGQFKKVKVLKRNKSFMLRLFTFCFNLLKIMVNLKSASAKLQM